MPPLNFPERGPRQAPWAHRKARFGAGTYCSKRRRTGAARPLGGTRTSRTPRNLRWKGNQRSTIHRSQRRWRPKVTSTFSPRQVGVPEGPLTSVRGETPSPVGGAPLGSRSAARGGRGAQTGMEDGRDVGSTSWPLTKMSIRHLSYISTDLFWTKISTANTKAAVLPLGAPVLLWDLSIYIQTHKFFSIQKICGCVTKKFLLPFSKSSQATNCLGRSANWLLVGRPPFPPPSPFILRASQPIRQLASPRGPGCPEAPPTQFREGGRHGGSPTGSRRPKQAPRRNGAPNRVVLGHVRGPGSPIPKIPFLWPRGLSDGGKPDAALSSWEDIYIGTGTLPLPYAAPTGTHHPQSNGTNLYIDWAKSPHTHQLAGASDHRQPSSPTGPPKPPTGHSHPPAPAESSKPPTGREIALWRPSAQISQSPSPPAARKSPTGRRVTNWLENHQLDRTSPTGYPGAETCRWSG